MSAALQSRHTKQNFIQQCMRVYQFTFSVTMVTMNIHAFTVLKYMDFLDMMWNWKGTANTKASTCEKQQISFTTKETYMGGTRVGLTDWVLYIDTVYQAEALRVC